jgi:hypothetical protein
MIGVSRIRVAGAAVLAAGLAVAAQAAPAPVGSLCNAEGRIEVFHQVSSSACAAEPDKELKAQIKARTEYQDKFGLSVDEKAQIDARIQRRIREIWKIKAAKAD